MIKKTIKRYSLWLTLGVVITIAASSGVWANEVEKGKIPAEHLAKSAKQLPWGAAIWDNGEAVQALKKGKGMLWIDTRPSSFFSKGTVRGARLMPYNKTGGQGNDLTRAGLETAIREAGLTKETAKIVFFCQGPKCHRSYNAAFVAIAQWEFLPANIVWFRDGYPNLFKEVKASGKLKRKAKRYLSDEALSQL